MLTWLVIYVVIALVHLALLLSFIDKRDLRDSGLMGAFALLMISVGWPVFLLTTLILVHRADKKTSWREGGW